MIRYYWDFFGPMGQGTAEHFKRHLIQFLSQHGLENAPAGVEAMAEHHHATWCEVGLAHRELIESHLRPRRAEIERDEE